MKDSKQKSIVNIKEKGRETQVARICRMEEILDNGSKALQDLQQALNHYASVEKDICELEQYYTGGQWQKDYADDEAGKLPGDLKRGVLSEDTVYDFLALRDEVLAEIRELNK